MPDYSNFFANIKCKFPDEEWGEEDEWEWEAEAEEEEISNPVKAVNGNSINGNVNGCNINGVMNGVSHKNGLVSNGTSCNKSSTVINEEDQEIEEVKGKADIKIEGNLLTIKRNGPIDWSDDEYEEDEEEIEPPPPPPPPPPPVPPPPPPLPPGKSVDFFLPYL